MNAAKARPLVVARRWDQLAGRLNTMANALVLAELADMDFRFVWIRGFDRHINDPGELFDQEFLDEHEIDEAELEGRPAVNFYYLEPTAASILGALAEAGDGAFIEMDEVFDTVIPRGETPELARERFQRCFAAMGWNRDIKKLFEFCARWPEDQEAAAIHIRAGDIVTGAWRHTLVHAKYCPTPFVHHAIEQLRNGDRQVLVLSDHRAYVTWLKQRYSVVTAAEVIPGYGQLTEIQQAIADVLLMSRCRPVLGPPASGFSVMAARLGAGEFERADTLAEPWGECDVLHAGIDERSNDAGREDFWGPLIARDACWAIDVFGDSLPLARQQELALVARRSDPGFGGAHTRLARLAALRGKTVLARDAARTSERLVQVERDEDPTAETNPLAEALAAQITVQCLAAIHAEAGLRRIAQRRLRREILDLSDTEDKFGRCLKLHPYWIEEGEAWESLRFVVETTKQIIAAPPLVRRRISRRLTARRFESSAMTAIEPDGLTRHRAAEVFDALTPELDRIGLHLYDATQHAGLITGEPRLVRAKNATSDQ